jgi:hypothetical protein
MDAWSHLAFLNPETRVFTETSWRSVMGFAHISLFRRIANIGLESSYSQLHAEVAQLFYALETDPDFAGIIKTLEPKKPLKPGWSLRLVASSADPAVQQQQQSFSVAVDAASLVFAHSILDDAAFQYCRVTAIVSPSSWEPFVLEKQVKLRETRDSNYESLLKQKVEGYLGKLERESLVTKSQKLFEICKPKPDFKPIREFSYDSNRLERLDQLRHDIVHGAGPVTGLPNGDDDVLFMKQCGLYLMSLVKESFDVQIVLPPEPPLG